MSTVFRTIDFDATGRTLEGIAFRYNVPSVVSDDGRTRYKEAYRASAGEGQAPVGLHLAHPHATHLPLEPRTEEALGTVEFFPDTEGLKFRAVVDDTPLGNAALVMLEAGGLSRQVSIGAAIRKSEKVRDVTYRTEIEIFELSLLPNGQKGALTGAQIEVVRQALESVPSKLIRHRLRVALLD